MDATPTINSIAPEVEQNIWQPNRNVLKYAEHTVQYNIYAKKFYFLKKKYTILEYVQYRKFRVGIPYFDKSENPYVRKPYWEYKYERCALRSNAQDGTTSEERPRREERGRQGVINTAHLGNNTGQVYTLDKQGDDKN